MYQVIVSQGTDRIRAALLQEDELIEYYEYNPTDKEILGDIRLAQVREVMPGLSAVFMNAGEKRPAFLPVSTEVLAAYRPGQELLVQIQKAAVGEKGIEVTDRLSFTGRYTVLTPSNPAIGVSGKINDLQERRRLKAIGEGFVRTPVDPQSSRMVGYVLRTESQGIPAEILQEESRRLYELYKNVVSRARYSRVGETVYSAGSALGKLLLSLPSSQLERIVVDDAGLLTSVEEEVLLQRPELQGCFKLYRDPAWNILDLYRISGQLTKAAQKRVLLPGGGYLFIEETEALSVIDVNTGKSVHGHHKEETLAEFNLKAIPWIVRQIILRNLSGIIIIDFIDMKQEQHQKQVLEALEQQFAAWDRRKTQIMGFTRLGLVEISRERKGLPLSKR